MMRYNAFESVQCPTPDISGVGRSRRDGARHLPVESGIVISKSQMICTFTCELPRFHDTIGRSDY
ncbi:hypothetical protein BD310DRAFT_932105 [Dichomitus squalens]|uniref:Uncharacterized protein n=1 Tax=Dichomitus squalens TaxID=114155 RepID=A0A4Q9PP35_9APHY|nr:hypothetical protein BD310DRAFT_932105 [Dichomitus squalens]